MIEELVLASGNPHKASEIESWFQGRGHSLRVLSANDFGGMDGCRETAKDFAGNARIKIDFLKKRVPHGSWILADDSGLEVDVLAGQPGVYSARFAGEGATDSQNRDLLLERMRKVRAVRKRSARFVCVIALGQWRKRTRYFRGECEGSVLREAAGRSGFGYDPIFVPRGYTQSFAELAQTKKNGISHRGRALEELEKALKP
ncbi:MAG: RdgB/HAM1 family non-canonical purine NTP pyrophosphatase [Verrucomicrobiota bacterium]